MSRWLKITLISVVVIFGLLLSSMVIVPWQIKKQGSHWVDENTQRTLTIEKAFFNPFTLTVEISGTQLTEQNSVQNFITFKRLMISASITSIIKQAIILDRVELDDPFINVELLGKQEFNFSDFTRLGEGKPEPAATEPKKPVHLSFNNIILTNGNIDFTDQTSDKKSQHLIRQLNLNVPFIGNIPYLTDSYVEPLLSMLLNGAEIRANGQLKPFHDSLETDLYLSLENVDLAHYAFHSPVPLPIDVKQGTLDCEIDLSYHISKSEKPRLMVGGELALSDIDLRELSGQNLFTMSTLILDLDWANLFTQDFNLVSLDIYEPQLYIDRDHSGLWNFQRITPSQQHPSPAKEQPAAEKQESEAFPFLTIGHVSLIDGKLHYRDDFVPQGFAEEIHLTNIDLNNLSNHLNQKTGIALKLQTGRQVAIETKGEIGINPATASIDFSLRDLSLAPYYPYLEEQLTAPIKGLLGLSGQFIYDEDGNFKVEQAQLSLNDLHVPFIDDDQFNLETLNISESSFDLNHQYLNLGKIQFNSGNIVATRYADGSLSPLKLLREQPQKEKAEESDVKVDSQPWQVRAESFDLQKFKFLLTDLTLLKKPQINISDFNIHAENLSYPEALTSPFSLGAKVGKRGEIKVDGSVIHTPLQLQAQTNIKAFPLPFLNNFVPEGINVNLKSGQFFSTLAINLKQQPDRFTGDFSGQLHVNNFDLRDPIGEGDLLVWKSLALDGISGDLSPLSLHIKDISLSDYLANIQIAPEGQVNLINLTSETQGQETETQDSTEKVPTTTDIQSQNEPAPEIRIDTLTLQNGTVSFIDRHLESLFSTTMYKLGGRVSGLSSAKEMQADVDLRGQLENHSPLSIQGKVNPLSQDLFADLTLSFKDIDLTPMTPYSGTFLGYVIDTGKLHLDLNYSIKEQQINATNKVMIDQFVFGETVESDKATSLPVAFAIDLLKDSNDEIHLDIPVSGDMSDPEFSIGGVILTVLKNLLVKAATSPFSLLTSALGGSEDFTSITFNAGETILAEEQAIKLEELAKMLTKRPGLILEISGFADKEQDPEGYRRKQLEQRLLAVKQRQAEGTGTSPTEQVIAISEEEYPETLLSVYKEAEFPRPRNFVGILKKIPVSEMKKLLLANIRVEEEQLQQLAKERAMAVRDTLVLSNEEIKPRLFLKKADIYQPPKNAPASRVEFNISSK